MRYLAGIDEAGLGPLLGPLTVGYSLIELAPARAGRSPAHPRDLSSLNLWQELEPVVSADPRHQRERIVVCDSKKLHSSSRGLGPLEDALWPCMVAALGESETPRSFRDLFARVCPVAMHELEAYPWYRDADAALPRKALWDKAAIRGGELADMLAARGMRLTGLGALPVLVGEFNRLLDAHASKSDAHFSAIAAVIANVWRQAGDHEITICCDRAGARTRYSEALKVHLKPERIEIMAEDENGSRYQLTSAQQGRQMEIVFATGGDSRFFTVSLASMMAKYLRELMVEHINAWFCARQPGLKPTKGYVTDGRRFVRETEALRKREAVSDILFIRKK